MLMYNVPILYVQQSAFGSGKLTNNNFYVCDLNKRFGLCKTITQHLSKCDLDLCQ